MINVIICGLINDTVTANINTFICKIYNTVYTEYGKISKNFFT